MIILIKFLATIKQWFWRLGDQAMPKESAKWVSSLEPHVFWSDVHSVAGWRPQDSCVRCPQWSDKQNFKSGICKWPVLDPTRKAMILWRNVGDHWRSFCSKCHYHRCAGQACWIGRSSEGISCCFWEKKMNENILRLAFAFLLLWEVLQFGKELLCFWKCFALRLTRGLNTKGLLRWIQKNPRQYLLTNLYSTWVFFLKRYILLVFWGWWAPKPQSSIQYKSRSQLVNL